MTRAPRTQLCRRDLDLWTVALGNAPGGPGAGRYPPWG